MAENSKIEWTHHTFNPWSGCTKVHAGCLHCYAEVNYSVKMRGVKWGPNGTRVKTANWSEPLKWNRAAEKAGERHRVFCASLADVFEDWQGEILDHNGAVLRRSRDGRITDDVDWTIPLTMNDLRRDLFALIDATPNLDWLLLTKRPRNIPTMWPLELIEGTASMYGIRKRPNVWLGTSVSDQETADKFVPELLTCRDLSPVLFLSAEPLLGPIDISYPPSLFPDGPRICCNGRECGCAGMPVDPWPWLYPKEDRIDWVIVGGESGHGARPCRGEWIESIIAQCAAADVPCFVKQMGSNHWYDSPEFGDRQVPLEDSKGGDWSEWPEAWRVRQFPVLEGAAK